MKKTELEKINEQLEKMLESAQDSFDSKSEKWQESEKGEIAQKQIDFLQSSVDSLCELIEIL